MSKKLIPKCLTAWTPIYRTNVNPFITDENQETLLALARATEGYRNGEYELLEKEQSAKKFRENMMRMAIASNPLLVGTEELAILKDEALLNGDMDTFKDLSKKEAVGTIGGAALAAAPFMIADAAAMGLPWWGNFVGEAATGMAGGIATDAAYKGLTGKSWTQGVRDMLPEGPKWISDENKDMLADMTNPGYWLSFGLTKQIGNGINQGIDSFIKTGKNILRRTNKYIKGYDRVNAFRKRLNSDYFEPLDKLRLNLDILMSALERENIYPESLNMALNNRREMEYLEALARRGYQQRVNFLIEYRPSMSPRRYETPLFRRSDEIDLSKVLDSRYNPNADKFTKDLIEIDGKYYLPKGGGGLYEVLTGHITIPKFGTDEVLTFNIEQGGLKSYFPVTNASTKNPTNLPEINLGEVSYNVPEEYINILQHNINYVLKEFPGARAFGSSVGVTETGLPHATHDVDVYILDKALDLYEKQKGKLPWGPGQEGLTKVALLDNGVYGEAGHIDLNIIRTKPDGTLDFTSDRSLNLFRQLYPDEYQKAYIAANGDRNAMYYPMQAQDVLDGVSVKNTIMDSFESGKSKHKSRALWYLNNGDVDLVYDSLLKHGESLVGKNMRHAPVTEELFLDPLYNLELLKRLELPGLANLELIANDPKRMKLIFEYWWLNNTIVSRGTSIESGRQGVRDFSKYAVRNMTEWSGGIGGNGSGTGLNTVLFGDSGGGVAGNDIYGQIQPSLYGFRDNMSPDELVTLVKRNFPHREQTLDTPILYEGRTLRTYQDILDFRSTISPLKLDELGQMLGIRGIVGGWYSDAPYVGIVSPLTKPDDILFINPADGRHGKYPHPTSAYSRRFNDNSKVEYLPNWFERLYKEDKHWAAYEDLKPLPNRNVVPKISELAENATIYELLLKQQHNQKLPEANESFRELNRAKEKLRQQVNDLHRANNKVSNLLHTAIEKQNNIIKLGTLGSAFMGISSLPFLLGTKSNKHIINDYLNKYNLTSEQLEILSKAESNEERVRLLKAWEHTNKLKKHKQGGKLISKNRKL